MMPAGEKVENILSRIVVIIWVFVVLILTSSYTASLSSLLTVQQLQPTVTSVQELQKNGDYVGYYKGSFVQGLLRELGFDDSKMRALGHPDEYVEALSKGSRNGGVSAMFHETPYIKLFLAQHCSGYTMVGPICKTAGFAYVFPKGSPLVPDVSRAILTITKIENKWFGNQTTCLNQGNTVDSSNLTFQSFWGLFLISGEASTCALLIFLSMFFYKNWNELRLVDRDKSMWARIEAWFRYYNMKDLNFYTFRGENGIDEIGHSNVNHRHSANIEVSFNVDELQDRPSFSHLPDGNHCPRQEEISSEQLVSPSSEAPLVTSMVLTN